jgi:hypothetical protein
MASPMPWAAPVNSTTLFFSRSPVGGSGTGGRDKGSAMDQNSFSQARQKPGICGCPDESFSGKSLHHFTCFIFLSVSACN